MKVLEKKVVKNGTAKTKSVSNKVGTAPKSVLAKSREITKEEEKTVVEKPKFSLEERIQRVDELRSLTRKRAVTLKTFNDLRTFSFTADDSCKLEITDSTHREFVTSNSNLINLLKNHLGFLLKGKINELDKQILDFEI